MVRKSIEPSGTPTIAHAGASRPASSLWYGEAPKNILGGLRMAGRLRDKVSLITGAGSGIGAATAVVFAQEGAKVALADLRPAGLETVAAQVKSAGSEALVMVGDVTSRPDSQRLVDEAVKRFGRVDVLGNSAGVAPRDAPADWGWEQVRDVAQAVTI